MTNPYEAENDILRKEVDKLTEENKRLKCRLKSLLEDCTGKNLHTLKNIVTNYCEDLSGDIPIIIDKGSYYKLGVSIEEYSIKQLKDWDPDCEDLKSFSDSTKVLLLT